MHSRIFQISRSPIDPNDYVDADHYCDEDWFLTSVADYIADVDDRDAELDGWLDQLNGVGLAYDSENKTLTVIDREVFFARKYAAFREWLRELASATLADFSGEGESIARPSTASARASKTSSASTSTTPKTEPALKHSTSSSARPRRAFPSIWEA